MSTLAVGDIQGCYEEFRSLLSLARFGEGDRLWLVGDLVNRGPESVEVLRFVRNLGARAVTVLGNHDLHLVARAWGFAKARSDDTLDDVLGAHDADELVDWLRARPMMHVEGERALVHAGLLPQWTVAKARSLAGEVEHALRGRGAREFIANLYGSRPDRWEDSLQGHDRLRVIVNAMTRLRFCTLQGVMDFHSKGERADAPAGYLPWFEVPGRASVDATIVCGHWSALGLKRLPGLAALDSGCVWGGQLSALRLEDDRLFQVPCRRSSSTPGEPKSA
jgi:bis(5'-nucleosyl)-tetraphosphatase (symmetrical)